MKSLKEIKALAKSDCIWGRVSLIVLVVVLLGWLVVFTPKVMHFFG